MTPRNALLAGLAGLAVAVLGWLVQPAAFAFGWVAALTAWLGWPLGSVALLLIHALTGGRWGEAIGPGLRLGVSTLPLLVPALIPVLLLLPVLYPWARPGVQLDNGFYLNVPFFLGRLVVYAVSWFGLAWVALRRPHWVASAAPPGLMLLAITLTFASIDLTMSLDPKFNSSIYGLLALAGAGLAALSAAILASAAAAEDAVVPDLARLLLGTVILWFYLDFMQLLIVWESDLAADAPWYLRRSTGPWGAVALLVALGHFVLPFGLLLFRPLQRRRSVLMGVAALLLAMEAVRAWWTVLPSQPRFVSWPDIGCVLAFAGFGAALALRSRPAGLVAHPV